MAVNEQTGDIVQVTETGYRGALCVGQKSMRLFFTRPENHASPEASGPRREPGQPRARRQRAPLEVVAIDLARARGARRVGDGELQRGVDLDQMVRERGLACPGGPAEDEQRSAGRHVTQCWPPAPASSRSRSSSR